MEIQNWPLVVYWWQFQWGSGGDDPEREGQGDKDTISSNTNIYGAGKERDASRGNRAEAVREGTQPDGNLQVKGLLLLPGQLWCNL